MPGIRQNSFHASPHTRIQQDPHAADPLTSNSTRSWLTSRLA
jgi:hypothetical protein